MTCRREGCTEPANTRWTRGIFAGLCSVHVEDERENARRRARAAAPARLATMHERGITPGRPRPVSGDAVGDRRKLPHVHGRDKEFVPRPPDEDFGEPRIFLTPRGERVPRPFDDPRVRGALKGFTENPEEFEVRVMSQPGAHRRAVKLSKIEMTRGGKVLRVAEAMARLRGFSWWELHDSRKAAFVRLAELAVEALELVEDDEANFDWLSQEQLEARICASHGDRYRRTAA